MRQAVFLEQAGDDVRDRGAVFGVLVHEGDVIDLLSAGLHVLEEVEIDFGEVAGHRRRPEEPFEAALGEIGRDQLAVDEGNAVFLGDRARRQRDAGLIGAGERNHFFLGDQAKRLVLPGRGAALVVGEHHLDLGAAEALEAGILRHRQVAERGIAVVDDLDRGFDRRLGVHAGAGRVAAQGKDRADLDGLVLGRGRTRHHCRHRDGGKQPDDMLQSHFEISASHPLPGSFGPGYAGHRRPALLLLVAQALHGRFGMGKLTAVAADAASTIN